MEAGYHPETVKVVQLGGIVVTDFIDMSEKHRVAVLRNFEELARDPRRPRSTVSRFSGLRSCQSQANAREFGSSHVCEVRSLLWYGNAVKKRNNLHGNIELLEAESARPDHPQARPKRPLRHIGKRISY